MWRCNFILTSPFFFVLLFKFCVFISVYNYRLGCENYYFGIFVCIKDVKSIMKIKNKANKW